VTALGLGAVAPASVAAAPLADVHIASRPATLHTDGSVDVVMSAKCKPTLQAFELDTSVAQPDFAAFGSDFKLAPPSVVPCDGKRHRLVVNVLPSDGEFRPGIANISVFLGLF